MAYQHMTTVEREEALALVADLHQAVGAGGMNDLNDPRWQDLQRRYADLPQHSRDAVTLWLVGADLRTKLQYGDSEVQ
jgi:hypothetical protein